MLQPRVEPTDLDSRVRVALAVSVLGEDDGHTRGSRGRHQQCHLVAQHMIPALGNRKLTDPTRTNELSPDDVDAWLEEKSEVLAARTLQDLRSILTRSINRAQRRDKVRRNVVLLCDELPTGKEGRPSKSLNMAQAEAVLDAAEADKSTIGAYIVTSLLTGARTEEARPLVWTHVVRSQYRPRAAALARWKRYPSPLSGIRGILTPRLRDLAPCRPWSCAGTQARLVDSTAKIRHDRRMLGRDRPLVVAVCGSPGAGKTTVASAMARRLGVPFLTRDEIKTGLGLSSASVAEDGDVQFNAGFHVAGGPVSLRAEAVMVDAARLLASSGVSFVVESSVLSRKLLDALLAGDARVLAVHVVADESVIDGRLRARAVEGGAVDQQLATQFQRGEMRRSIFEPLDGVDAVVEVDTSDHGDPVIEPIEAAVIVLLATTRSWNTCR